ncbi:: Unstab_antitox [Gemmata massiliana]|uniref:: Unstab_antitox n=1 Tax=Gemmata massiliana TaxID=1210884 RepID=A0A6P2CWD7_9BACT|nr:addiction module protein [Gemmata massiliana]VTR92706.1 : Unstab_antitox [Gemmata massiliana]
MSEATEKLKPLLAALTAEERAEVAEYIDALDSDHENDEGGEENLAPEEWEAVWIEEGNRRIADLDSGKSEAVPADEFMKRMKEKYG